MELKEFILSMQSDLEAFERFWEEGSKKEAEHFPRQMGEGDWFDQFIIFESNVD